MCLPAVGGEGETNETKIVWRGDPVLRVDFAGGSSNVEEHGQNHRSEGRANV